MGHYRVAAAEIMHVQADAEKSSMELTIWRGAKPRKQDVTIDKNYLSEDELRALNNLAEQYLSLPKTKCGKTIFEL